MMISNISSQNSLNSNPSFSAGKLTIKQKPCSNVAEVLKRNLSKGVKKMPDGDKLIVTIEPLSWQIRTNYVPGAKAPQGADRLTLLTTACPSNIEDTVTFADDLSQELRNPKGFSLIRLVKKMRVMVGNGFDRLFAKKSGEVKYDPVEDVYVLGKSGEKVEPS